MKRREAFKKSALVMAALAFDTPALAFQTRSADSRRTIVSFKNGVHSAALKDGTWNLWVRANPRNVNILTIRLLLQVSEDEQFTSIVSKEILVAQRKNGYIVKNVYKTNRASPPLFYRYIVLPANPAAYASGVQVSPLGIMKPLA